MACFEAGGQSVLCVVVCDGAGSAQYGGQGAAIGCRAITTSLRQHFATTDELPDKERISCWIDDARDRLGIAADKRSLPRRAFASTLVMLVAARSAVTIAHIGDGAVVGRSAAGDWEILSAPENGEYASTTYFLTDDPAPRLRFTSRPGVYTALAAFSDGIESLVLDQQLDRPHLPFFSSMIAPVDRAASSGRLRLLSADLAQFLHSPRISDRTDDDKTLILASAR